MAAGWRAAWVGERARSAPARARARAGLSIGAVMQARKQAGKGVRNGAGGANPAMTTGETGQAPSGAGAAAGRCGVEDARRFGVGDPELGLHVGGRHGPGEEVALHPVAAGAAQEDGLGLLLDALGDDAD